MGSISRPNASYSPFRSPAHRPAATAGARRPSAPPLAGDGAPPAFGHRAQQAGRAAEEGLAGAPVWTDAVELHRREAPFAPAEAHVQPVAGMRAPQGAELAGEDHPVGAALAVH